MGVCLCVLAGGQMAYWGVHVANLVEAADPALDFIHRLAGRASERGRGKRSRHEARQDDAEALPAYLAEGVP